eukprot:3707818-Rhodomonas_salina.2
MSTSDPATLKPDNKVATSFLNVVSASISNWATVMPVSVVVTWRLCAPEGVVEAPQLAEKPGVAPAGAELLPAMEPSELKVILRKPVYDVAVLPERKPEKVPMLEPSELQMES